MSQMKTYPATTRRPILNAGDVESDKQKQHKKMECLPPSAVRKDQSPKRVWDPSALYF